MSALTEALAENLLSHIRAPHRGIYVIVVGKNVMFVPVLHEDMLTAHQLDAVTMGSTAEENAEADRIVVRFLARTALGYSEARTKKQKRDWMEHASKCATAAAIRTGHEYAAMIIDPDTQEYTIKVHPARDDEEFRAWLAGTFEQVVQKTQRKPWEAH